MRRFQSPARLQILGIVFAAAVVAVVVYTHQLILPIALALIAWSKPFLVGLLGWSKLWIKKVTPKLGLLLLKNSLVIQARRLIVRASAHLFVKSYKPWRRFITRTRLAIVASAKRLFVGYMELPIWLRTTIAVAVLIATAGSSFAVLALLIVPQPLIDWLKSRVVAILNKLGVTRFFAALWKLAVPGRIRHRWYMYVKWRLGRQQVRAAKRLHEKVAKESSRVDSAVLAEISEP